MHFRFNALTFGKCLQQKAAEHVTLRNCITVPQVKIKLKKTDNESFVRLQWLLLTQECWRYQSFTAHKFFS